jgi:hypothetical protein
MQGTQVCFVRFFPCFSVFSIFAIAIFAMCNIQTHRAYAWQLNLIVLTCIFMYFPYALNIISLYIMCISISSMDICTLRSDNIGMGQHGDLVDHGF